MKKLFSYCLILFLTSQLVTAQFGYYSFYHPVDTNGFTANKKAQYGFQMGTGFSSFAGGMSSTYYNPYVTIKASQNLFIQTGISSINNNIGGFSMVPSFGKTIAPNQSQSVVVNSSALYKVNGKLNLYAALYGSFGESNMYSSQLTSNFNQQAYGTDSKGATVGFDYKLLENVKISGTFNYIKNQSYNPNSLSSNYMNPFNTSPFFGGW